MAEKMRKVIDVPTAGIVTNVGRNVPIILPTVLNAPSVPTIFPLSSKLSTEYFASDGVTVPSKKRGKTKIIMQVRNAAQIRKFVLIEIIIAPVIKMMMYFPRTGIAAIHTAAIKILL